jgi:protein-tyrosine phosphatase
MSRRDASKYTFSSECIFDCIIVSITDAGSSSNNFNEENNYVKAILPLQFDDVDYGQKNCITSEDARMIIDFVLKWINKVNLVIVHCEAGVSRSAGVCAALMKIFNGSDFEIFNKPRYIPNMSCYRAILESYFKSYNSKEAK